MPHETVKFLLVDDLDRNLLALEALLRRDGLELFTAHSGTEALELLLAHDFALALLDVQMAGMDGFELAELMRGMERTRRIPIIFLTAVATDERRRFRGYEAGAVDYLFKPVDPQILRNKAAIFFELDRQRQELAQQRDELRATADRLSEALGRLQAHSDNSPLAMVEFDDEFRVTAWSRGAERDFGWSALEVIGKRATELAWIHQDDSAAFADLIADLRAGRLLRSVHVSRNHRKDGSVVDCEWYNSALLDASGKLVSVSSQILNVTERRRAEETQQLLIGELNHRVKNTLATVQAIATQTLRYSRDPTDFAANFSGRIEALARAHSLLSTTTWQGANLVELVQDQLGLTGVNETRLTASGPEVWLPPHLALHLALILHELGTNARKYGALSTAEGRVSLIWTVEGEILHLIWLERSGPVVRAPSRPGFGTALIEQSARAEGGKALVSYRADGIGWDITLALPHPSPDDLPDRATNLATSPRQVAQLAEPEDVAGSTLAGRRFLVIEDEPLVALVLTDALEDAGAEVVGPAGSVDEALRLIRDATVDGAILDGNLRGEPVDEVAAALTRRNIPFLFVSGYGRANLPRAFNQAAMLGKPFTHSQLLEAVKRLIAPPGEVIQLRNSGAQS